MIITHQTKHSLDKVLPYFSDFEKFGSIHPHINKVEKTKKGLHVTEQILFLGFIPNRNEYDVTVESTDNIVTYKSQVKSNVSLQLIFRFAPSGNGTTIQEEIIIESSGLVRKILTTTLVKAHAKLVGNLNELP